MKPKFKILSIDGGGIRGVIPCKILEFIESQIGGDISNCFDLIAGTSTGGIIGLGLASVRPGINENYTSSEMLALYKEHGKLIFQNRQPGFWSELISIFGIKGLPKKLTNNPYESKQIEDLLSKYFGNNMLSGLNTNLLVTTYDIEKSKPFYFSSRLAKGDPNEDFLIREIARSTSAAPTYFEPSILKSQEKQDMVFVDGGVFANNPSILAYAEAKESWKSQPTKAFQAIVTADDDDFPFYLLSLGTGSSPKSITGEDAKKWNTSKWIDPLLTNVFMQSVAESTHYTMQHLMPPYKNGYPRYHRLDFIIPEANSQMDDASDSNIQKLCELADDYIRKNMTELLKICEILK